MDVGGFAGRYGEGDGEGDLRKVQNMLDRIRHRSLDDLGVVQTGNAVLGQHGRIAVDVGADGRPWKDRARWFVGDVEVYGFASPEAGHAAVAGSGNEASYHGMTDEIAAEAILRLYGQQGPRCVECIDGAFAFALYDETSDELFAARDALGVKPLYYGFDEQGAFCFASEIKGLLPATEDVREFPPGHYWTNRRGFVQFYELPEPGEAAECGFVVDAEDAVQQVHDVLTRAVHKRLETDAPLGAFVSGGLDSSLIAAMAVQRQGELPSFAVGMEGSADLAAARVVADHLRTDHYEYVMTPEDIEEALPETIYHLESYDPLLVRSAIANYFAARLASEHVDVVLVGEGADELFAGYDYLKRYARNEELAEELHAITQGMHSEGLQRLDRLTAAHGLASRPPFLDGELVDLAFRIDPRLKMYGCNKVEKWVLRKVAEDYLPDDIIWREKEKFAEGTGTDDVLAHLAERFVAGTTFSPGRVLPDGTEVTSPEQWMYYEIYCRFFPEEQPAAV